MATPPQPLRPDFASLEVDRFESVPGGRELALLRLEGRYRSRLARPLLEAALLVDDGLAIHRHEPLPDSAVLEPGANDEDWVWRAAFAVSLAVLGEPGVVNPVQTPRVRCPPTRAPAATPPATKATGSSGNTQTAKGGKGSTGKGGTSTDKSGKGSKPAASGPTSSGAHTQRKGRS